uniref:Uncharacterized protein n=1 Tax=Oryza glumipatula TaxID=40148 RepID=A0A0D9Y8U3_9ORYZ
MAPLARLMARLPRHHRLPDFGYIDHSYSAHGFINHGSLGSFALATSTTPQRAIIVLGTLTSFFSSPSVRVAHAWTAGGLLIAYCLLIVKPLGEIAIRSAAGRSAMKPKQRIKYHIGTLVNGDGGVVDSQGEAHACMVAAADGKGASTLECHDLSGDLESH